MIEKNWSDIEIYNYCRTHKITEVYNKEKQKIPYKEIVTTITDLESVKLGKLRKWAIENCSGYWKICKFHLGYGNYIVFKFSSSEDFSAFDRFYDKIMYPKIDVLM